MAKFRPLDDLFDDENFWHEKSDMAMWPDLADLHMISMYGNRWWSFTDYNERVFTGDSNPTHDDDLNL